MTEIAVIAPVLGRPHAAAPLAASLETSDPAELCRLVFVCSPDDHAQIAACSQAAETLIIDRPPGPGDYVAKLQHGFEQTREPFVFQAADDLEFQPGWADAVLEIATRFDVGVIGTDDRGNRNVMAGRHSTHSLFARCYVERFGTIDEPGQVMHPGYRHNFCDTEAVETARVRGCFAFARDAVVVHNHPHWGKGRMDATYERGLKTFDQDARLWRTRQRLLAGAGVAR